MQSSNWDGDVVAARGSAAEATDAPLYPPAVVPPPRPLGLLSFLYNFVRNPLRSVPAAVYSEPLVSVVVNGRVMAWVTDPALLEIVLLKQVDSFRKPPLEARVFGPVLGQGILTAQGDAWRRQRRIASPAFRHAELLAFVPAMTRAAERQVERFRAASTAGARVQPIDHAMEEVTFDIITSTVLAGCRPEEGAAIRSAAQTYLDGISWELAYGILEFPHWLWHPHKRSMRAAAERLRGAVGSLLARRMAEPEAGHDLLARLIAARDSDAADGAPGGGGQMPRELLVDNLATFLIAGHETTAKALTWTLYLLARAPGWQQRVRDEVGRVAGSEPITAAHVERLPITQRVLKEAMRLYPPAPVMTRMTTEPVQLGAHHFPAGSLLILPVYAIHRHRTVWPDPARFDPDRFTETREKGYARTQFMPFGFGPRICIGQAFAMIEATVLLATFVRAARFDWDGRHLPEPVSRITLRPKGGMPLGLTPLPEPG